MNIELTASCLTHVNEHTEMSFECSFKAHEQAEIFTMLGFEVDGPTSLDGETFTITVSR
jgi:hypothetical protein